MRLRETLKLIEHKGPNQTIILVRPTDVQLVEACQQVSHHIIVECKEPPTDLMAGRGWELTQTGCIPDGYWHYTPIRLKPRKWEDFWGTYDYPEHIEGLVNRLEDGDIVVEVGTYHGKCAAHIAQCAKHEAINLYVYSIDTFGWAPEYRPHPPLSWQRTTQSFKDAGLQVETIQGLSQQIIKQFHDESIKHVHLDGARGPSMLKELKAWLPKIRNTGTVSGVDAVQHREALDELYDHLIIKEDLDIWVVFKRHLK